MSNLIFAAYNIVYWIPLVLVLAGTIDTRTAFVTFALIILARAIINVYRVNTLDPARARYFPLRAP